MQKTPLYLQGGRGHIHQHRTPSDESGVLPLSYRSFHFMDVKSLVSEQLHSKLQSKNLKYRAENGPVL